MARYSHRVCEQSKLVSYPLSRFPLDSLDFYGIHWNETSIMLVSNINRNERAHQSLKPRLYEKEDTRHQLLCTNASCVNSSSLACVKHIISSRDIMWARISPRKYCWPADVRDEEELWPDVGHGNGKSNTCGEGRKGWAFV